MERHRCKLCSRSFMNGRALGGHMRSHLATLPLPLKKQKTPGNSNFQLGGGTESDSSSTRSEDENNNNNNNNKLSSYELRDNPRKSVKALDPEFMDAGSIVVQDRESETESTQNPTRRRSKRASQRTSRQLEFEVPKKCKWVGSESAAESTPVSSVSDPSQDEEVALCLMMLSRDAWERVEKEKSVEDTNESATELKTGLITRRPATRVAAKFKCLGCKKVFRTGRALAGHKASNKQCCHENSTSDDHVNVVGVKIFECPFCYKVFGSGQALGGHKRSHLLGPSSTNNNNNNNNNANVVASNNADRVGETTTTTTTTNTSFILDLNLPAPFEDDDEDDHIS
ncbi:zinc finger protein ZAT9-like [Silene latifolia]|uniref:zinc finger protein ZAT9-like n=1 Tax=Silene latifolia TaxID=37657 RepID=UPI003D77AABD